MSLSKALSFLVSGKRKVPKEAIEQRRKDIDIRFHELSMSFAAGSNGLKKEAGAVISHYRDMNFAYALDAAARAANSMITSCSSYLDNVEKAYSAARKDGIAFDEKPLTSVFSPALEALHIYALALACSAMACNDPTVSNDKKHIERTVSALSKRLAAFSKPLPGRVKAICTKNRLHASKYEIKTQVDKISKISAELLGIAKKKDFSVNDIKRSKAAGDFEFWKMPLPWPGNP